MTRWAVSYIEWNDHDLVTEIIHADDWRTALRQHSRIKEYDLFDVPTELYYAKEYFFEMDSMIEVVQIPDAKED